MKDKTMPEWIFHTVMCTCMATVAVCGVIGVNELEKQQQVQTRCVDNDKVFTKGDAIDTIEYHPDCLGRK